MLTRVPRCLQGGGYLRKEWGGFRDGRGGQERASEKWYAELLELSSWVNVVAAHATLSWMDCTC